jgi:hypothetical protein
MLSLVPRKNQAIFAGVADRVVPAVEASTLWHHWEEPRIAWYSGTHRAFLGTPEGRALVSVALRASNVLPGEVPPDQPI